MPFIFYLSLLLFTASAALFGLDLMTAPLPPTDQAAVSGTVVPPGPERARNKMARRMADRHDATIEGDPQHVLTPIYPANPGGVPVVEQSTSTIANRDTTARHETTGAAPHETTGAAMANDRPASSAQPVAQQAANSCDVDACAAHYRSFRATDCTYQPYEGPRRFCELPGMHDRSAAREVVPQAATPIRAITGNSDLARSYVPVHQSQAALPFSSILFPWSR
jgi:BA14K-like protein